MPYTKSDVSLYYEIAGTGRPVVLIHGWPLSSRMWEYQVPDLVAAGFSCITYDRRGFGDSNRPWDGYEYETLTADLDNLLTELDLHDVALVGFSMGGGEVARYLGTRGSNRVSRAVLMSSVTPYLHHSSENPAGVPVETLEGFGTAMTHDRIGFLEGFGQDFFGLPDGGSPDKAGGPRDVPSDALTGHFLQIEAFASPSATRDCAAAFGSTDFTADLGQMTVPTMILHGSADKIVPFDATGKRAAKLIAGSRLEVIEGGPHGIWYTHRQKVNELLIDFLNS